MKGKTHLATFGTMTGKITQTWRPLRGPDMGVKERIEWRIGKKSGKIALITLKRPILNYRLSIIWSVRREKWAIYRSKEGEKREIWVTEGSIWNALARAERLVLQDL